jgi:hypothetical protein
VQSPCYSQNKVREDGCLRGVRSRSQSSHGRSAPKVRKETTNVSYQNGPRKSEWVRDGDADGINTYLCLPHPSSLQLLTLVCLSKIAETDEHRVRCSFSSWKEYQKFLMSSRCSRIGKHKPDGGVCSRKTNWKGPCWTSESLLFLLRQIKQAQICARWGKEGNDESSYRSLRHCSSFSSLTCSFLRKHSRQDLWSALLLLFSKTIHNNLIVFAMFNIGRDGHLLGSIVSKTYARNNDPLSREPLPRFF